MKKPLLAALALALVVLLAVAGYAAYLLRSLDTPQTKEALLASARTALGTDLQVESLRISLLSGVALEGVTVRNPTPLRGDLLTAKSLVLQYRLLPLLTGRLKIDRLTLDEPRVHLSMDAQGHMNYERLGAATVSSTKAPAATFGGLPIELEFDNLAVRGAAVEITDHRKVALAQIEGVSFESRFSVTKEGLQGKGRASIVSVKLGQALLLREVVAPLEATKRRISLAPISALLAGGTAGGEFQLDMKNFGYSVRLDVQKVSVAKLLEEAGSSQSVTGSLQAKATFEGSGGLPTLRGRGSAQIADCRVANARTLAVLSAALKLPDLANPDFDECVVEFNLEKGRFQTPVLRLVGKQVQITGRGVMNLESSALDYDMTLALARPLLNKITVPELRSAFTDRGDGFSTIAFDVTGSSAEPKTNLTSKVATAAAKQAVVGGIGRLLGGKKK